RTSVSVGDPADLVIVDDDPAEVGRTRLPTLPASATLVAGRWTYLSEVFADSVSARTRPNR
ncbi:MAG: hypothetical protein ACRDO7_08775, partial [Nocardioidaceae bacterium]